MSGWTILTVTGKEAQDYEHTRYDSTDTWDSTSDIVATMEEDSRVRRWRVWKGHVYAYLRCSRYDFGFAEDLLEDYSEMADCAVVLGANDTTDTGVAKYYSDVNPPRCIDTYEEHQGEDGTYVGEIALSVMTSRHGIVARDPFHNTPRDDDRYHENGQSRLQHMED